MRRARSLAVLWLSAALGLVTSAGAQPKTNDTIIDPTLVRSRAGFGERFTTFHLPEGSGHYETTAAVVDVAAMDLVSVRALLPFHVLWLDGHGTRSGVGDFDLKLKIRVLSTSRWVVAVGADAQYPTGSARKGLGGGALQMAPFVTAGFEIRHVILYGTVTDAITLREPNAPDYASFVDPNTDHEVTTTFGMIWRIDSTFLVNASLDDITVVTPRERDRGTLQANVVLGVAFTESWRGTFGFEAPLAGAHRFDERGTATFLHFF